MSADDATQTTTAMTEGARPPFDDHDFGGDVEHHETPDHVAPYASREDAVPTTSPVSIPDHVAPYSSRD
ncbi:hypothetical protein [Agrococcus jejuensis]|uniref:Uncharacterized protein n=1 Tax=Agrococcus jejuensis TaxID=399736 RepID=A0A1G8E2J1_9MICO|nr:hypothetical protein [Agrococcus jejuensis]SDH64143.1 hypothetical protein SAMN04489720_1864 [Agrococcus jejuensis]